MKDWVALQLPARSPCIPLPSGHLAGRSYKGQGAAGTAPALAVPREAPGQAGCCSEPSRSVLCCVPCALLQATSSKVSGHTNCTEQHKAPPGSHRPCSHTQIPRAAGRGGEGQQTPALCCHAVSAKSQDLHAEHPAAHSPEAFLYQR